MQQTPKPAGRPLPEALIREAQRQAWRAWAQAAGWGYKLGELHEWLAPYTCIDFCRYTGRLYRYKGRTRIRVDRSRVSP